MNVRQNEIPPNPCLMSMTTGAKLVCHRRSTPCCRPELPYERHALQNMCIKLPGPGRSISNQLKFQDLIVDSFCTGFLFLAIFHFPIALSIGYSRLFERDFKAYGSEIARRSRVFFPLLYSVAMSAWCRGSD